jgi:hypothetical protein
MDIDYMYGWPALFGRIKLAFRHQQKRIGVGRTAEFRPTTCAFVVSLFLTLYCFEGPIKVNRTFMYTNFLTGCARSEYPIGGASTVRREDPGVGLVHNGRAITTSMTKHIQISTLEEIPVCATSLLCTHS